MNPRRERKNQLERRGGDEGWRPIACADVGPVRRFFDLQAGTIWRDLRDQMPRVRGTLVDVGCGAQPYRSLMPTGTDYVGIDTAEAPTAFGYDNPETRYYDGERWPIEDASVDWVLATETLEHIKDPAQFLREAQRCLRPRGHLLLTVPFAARWHFIPADYWRFTPSGLGEVLGGSGFVDIVVLARGNAATVACYKAMALFTRFIWPQTRSILRAVALRIIGVAVLPAFLGLAVLGNISLAFGDGDDCLGYTVSARKGDTPS